jgi:hypothetical protein
MVAKIGLRIGESNFLGRSLSVRGKVKTKHNFLFIHFSPDE